jgi:glycosyltransferase involved in cell wall biosynthesis
MPQPILFILDKFIDATAGTESQIVLLLRMLDRARFTPRVVLLRGPDGLSRHVPDVPVEVVDVQQIRSPLSWWRAWRCAWAARRAGVRLAHIFFNDASAIFPLPLRLAGLRVLISRRDLGFWYTPSLLKLLRLSNRFVDAVVCNARAVQDVVIAQEHVPAARTTVIYNGISREPTSASREELRDRFGLPHDAFVVVTVANLRPLKRIDSAIGALARMKALSPAPMLVVAGADRAGSTGKSHREELESHARSLGVADRVRFLGAVDDPMPLLGCADVAVLCSETEGLSNSVIEYLLAGKPVVCTPVGGSSELVEEGVTGYFFEVGDEATLAARLMDLHANPAVLSRMSRRAMADARTRFDARPMAEAHERLYEHLLRYKRARTLPLPEQSAARELRGRA